MIWDVCWRRLTVFVCSSFGVQVALGSARRFPD